MADSKIQCPCGSEELFENCCGPVLETVDAPTPEALMRARYTAYVTHKTAFLGQSLHPNNRSDFDEKAVDKWSREANWQSLTIVSTSEKGNEGYVEFIARYKQETKINNHHEHAEFKKVDGKWYFWDGKMAEVTQVKREAPKVGRNDPCTCGSGKKFKKCCA
jgi:SEC-C motif-containing protein